MTNSPNQSAMESNECMDYIFSITVKHDVSNIRDTEHMKENSPR